MNEESKPTIHWVRSPSGMPEYYANMVHLMWSLDDVRFRLGQLVESPETIDPGPNFKAVSQENVAVTISWRNAKLLRDQLTNLVEAYEKANGQIKTDVKLAPSSE